MRTIDYRTFKMLLTVFMLIVSSGLAIAQTQDSIQTEKEGKKVLKNTVRINITNPLIFGESFILGYERTLGHRQSFSVNIGSFSLPQMRSADLGENYEVESSGNKGGYNFAVDYRFYLSKLNKYDAPRGVYIGPYASMSRSKRRVSLTSDGVVGSFDAGYTFQAMTFGAQLGYQFVFWRRLSLDLILMGPGISGYSLETTLSTTLDPAQEEELFQKINDAIAAKIPGYDKVIEPGTMHRGDTFKTTSAGYRYVVMLGFRF